MVSDSEEKIEQESIKEMSEQPTKITQEELDHLNSLTELKASAQSAAEKALLKHENAELQYKNFVLQIYMKYKLSMEDNVSPDGTFIKANDQGKE